MYKNGKFFNVLNSREKPVLFADFICYTVFCERKLTIFKRFQKNLIKDKSL